MGISPREVANTCLLRVPSSTRCGWLVGLVLQALCPLGTSEAAEMPPPTQNHWRRGSPAKYRRLWRQTPLFQTEDGAALRFYIRPGPAKVEVAPLILRQGGRLCAVQEPGSILLASPGEIPAGAPGVYISTAYITDCLMCNRLLPLEDYCLNPPQSPQAAGPSGSTSGGRMAFTVADDQAIVLHVQSRRQAGQADHLAGTAFWKEMAQAQVTAHPWQAMRDRYLKHLRGKEELYQPGRNSQRRVEPRTNNAGGQEAGLFKPYEAAAFSWIRPGFPR